MNNLLKEAIADAKAVRETALANAKIALEEAFTPRLQSMLSARLSEEEEGYEEEVPVSEDDMPMDEPEVAAPVEAPVEEGEYEFEETYEDLEPEMPEAPVEEGELDFEEPAAEAPVEAPVEEEEDLELEAILRELEEEGDFEEAPVEEQSGSTNIGKGDNKVATADAGDEQDPGKGDLTEEGEEEDVDLEEIINALREEEGDDANAAEPENGTALAEEEGEAVEAELEEAYKVIRFMKSKLNEVNLLNAKLLFSNKLFRNHSLNEGQKMKVIENFDRAQSLREVKLVFATLSESFKFNGKRVKTIKESYASKASRSTRPTRNVLSEGAAVANRFKKLAGLL